MSKQFMSQLFTTSTGRGRPIVLLHGWGMNHTVWDNVIEPLSQQGRVTRVDLPGHGLSHRIPMGRLEQVIDTLEPLLQSETVVIGWSLGGLLGQALAIAFPERIRALLLVASTPCFVKRPHWQHGLPHKTLAGFAQNLETDYQATIKRFFTLQFMGTRSEPSVLKNLRDKVLKHPASPEALRDGLAILQDTDFTEQLTTTETLWVLGKLDKLIPVSLAEAGATWGRYHQVKVMNRAAHVPFVTHADAFMGIAVPFIEAACND